MRGFSGGLIFFGLVVGVPKLGFFSLIGRASMSARRQMVLGVLTGGPVPSRLTWSPVFVFSVISDSCTPILINSVLILLHVLNSCKESSAF